MMSSCMSCRRLLPASIADVANAARVLRAAALTRREARGSTSLSHSSDWMELLSGLRCEDLPDRLIFLNGAPGSGKTKALDTVRAFSGISTAYSMSAVIARHKKINADTLKSMSGLAGDDAACSALASTIRTAPLGEKRELILDGFPRSEAQVDFLEQLIHHVRSSRAQCGITRKQLDVCMVLLHVDEATSIKRQMARQIQAEQHNAAVRGSGKGTLMEERITDKSRTLCRDRFAVFARSMPALRRIERLMNVYHIDATKTLETCSHDIATALIRHPSPQSEAPVGTAPQYKPLPASSESDMVRPWWITWSKWLGGAAPGAA